MIKFLKQKNRACPAKLQRSRGFTLVETLIAISIFSVSIVAMMSILGRGISDVNYAKKKMTASYLAQEGIEYIRNMRDNYIFFDQPGKNWNSFKAQLSSCNQDNNCNLNIFEGTPPEDYVGFNRGIWAETISNNEVKIYSKVSWTQGSGPINITLTENLFNWVE